jgi:putative hydrolase of the HAD superfamily
MAPPSAFRGVIFDLFGTLVGDFVAGVSPTDRDLSSILNAPRDSFQQLWRQTARLRIDGTFQSVEASIAHVCDTIGVKPTKEQIDEAAKFRLEQIRRALNPKLDAAPTLAQLKKAGYKLGLLSNCSIEIPTLWPEIPLASFFETAVFSSRDRISKPDPRIFQLACERLGVEPNSCVYIADGENHELAAATKLGMRAVLIRNPAAEKRPDLFREVAEWQGDSISTLSEVAGIVP